jgi:hypothetical protein
MAILFRLVNLPSIFPLLEGVRVGFASRHGKPNPNSCGEPESLTAQYCATLEV